MAPVFMLGSQIFSSIFGNELLPMLTHLWSEGIDFTIRSVIWTTHKYIQLPERWVQESKMNNQHLCLHLMALFHVYYRQAREFNLFTTARYTCPSWLSWWSIWRQKRICYVTIPYFKSVATDLGCVALMLLFNSMFEQNWKPFFLILFHFVLSDHVGKTSNLLFTSLCFSACTHVLF